MAEEEEKPIRVIDRRMFTSEGELRPEVEAETASATAPSPAPAVPAPSPAAPPSAPEEAATEEPGAGTDPRSEFASLVRSLATTAYAALGLLPDPATGERHRDPGAARQMIDWLAVLEQKTRKNLSFEESDFLARVLYELRLSFVEVTRPPSP